MTNIFKNLLSRYLKKIWHEAASENNQILISLVTPVKQAKILDIGVFDGNLALERVKNILHPNLYAVDIDKTTVKKCLELGIKASKYNLEKGLPFKSNFFDVVIANQIIEHLTNIDNFVEEIHRVLKPKGYLLLSTENLSSWHNIFALVLGWQAFSQHISINSTIGNPMRMIDPQSSKINDLHIKIFTLKGLKELFKFYGFKIEYSFGAGYYPFPKYISRSLSKLNPVHSAFIGIKARKR